MFTFLCKFYPKDMSAEDFFDNPLSSFLREITHNGQLIGDWNLTEVADRIELVASAPDDDSLDAKYYTDPCKHTYEELVAQSTRKPDFTPLGPIVESSNACRCSETSSYLLLTSFLHISPPVRCLDCAGHVPLYRLPLIGDITDYSDILCWERHFKIFDELYMGSAIAELYAVKQLRDPKSELTQEGLSICKKLSAEMGKPFYYYLLRRKRNGDLMKDDKCPSCGGEWDLADEPAFGWMS